MIRLIYAVLLMLIFHHYGYCQSELEKIIDNDQKIYLTNAKTVTSKLSLLASLDIQNDTLSWKLTIQNNNDFDIWFFKPFFPKGYTSNYVNAVVYFSKEDDSPLNYMQFLDGNQTIAFPDLINTFFIDSSNAILIKSQGHQSVVIRNELAKSNLVELYGTFSSKIIIDYKGLEFLSENEKKVYKGQLESNLFEINLK